MDLHAVVAPSVVRKLNDTRLSLHGNLRHLVRAVDIALQSVEGFAVVKADTTRLRVACLHVGDVEGGVAAYLEVDLAGVSVQHVPDHTDRVPVEHITHAEGEIIGIHLARLVA